MRFVIKPIEHRRMNARRAVFITLLGMAVTAAGQVSFGQETIPVPGSGCGPRTIRGVYCPNGCPGGELKWNAAMPIPFDVMAQGEYIGPVRKPDVRVYRIRVDDILVFDYRLTQTMSAKPYRLEVGDQLHIESLSAPELTRDVAILPDGTITLPQIGQFPAANRTVEELRIAMESAYKTLIKDPIVTITPTVFNTRLQELRATVDSRGGGDGGQFRRVRVTPEGTVQLPGIATISVQGLSIRELYREVNARYAKIVSGLQVNPTLSVRAPRFVYIVGEVATAGRYELTGPTTVMQAIALAGSWNVGANLRQVVVFRRDANWCLMATKLNIRGPLFGNQPCPADDIWLRDSDIVVIPKNSVLVANEVIDQVFTRGLYGVLPINYNIGLPGLSTL